MLIHAKGFKFKCNKCGTILEANRTSEFHSILCNGEDQIYVLCPICGEKRRITAKDIPKNIQPYVKVKKIDLFSSN